MSFKDIKDFDQRRSKRQSFQKKEDVHREHVIKAVLAKKKPKHKHDVLRMLENA